MDEFSPIEQPCTALVEVKISEPRLGQRIMINYEQIYFLPVHVNM